MRDLLQQYLKDLKIYWLHLIVFGCVLLLYGTHVVYSFGFDNDFARDLQEIHGIAHGKLRLLGPGSSFGGIITGAYYYYLLVPAYVLFSESIAAILIFHVIFFSLSLAYFFYETAKHFGKFKGVLLTACMALLPMLFFAARHPGNAYTYLPFSLGVLTYIYFNEINSKLKIVVLGFVMGVIVNTHFSNVIFLIAVCTYLFFTLKKKSLLFYFLSAFVVSFMPHILFELRHQFVMTKNLFANQAYKPFVENSQLGAAVAAKKNIFENTIFLSKEMRYATLFNPFWYLLAGGVALSQKYRKRESVLYGVTLLAFGLLIVILRFQFAIFYTYQVALLIYFSALILVGRSKFYLLLIPFLALALYYFPIREYGPSPKPYKKYDQLVEYILNQNMVTRDSQFNVLLIRPDTIIAPHGSEYRYVFMKKGYNPLPGNAFARTKTLVIISDVKDYDLNNFINVEMTDFGREHIAKAQKYQYGDKTIYRLAK